MELDDLGVAFVLPCDNFAPFRSHAVPYFLHSNIMPITMLYFKLSSMLMFDVYNNTARHNISHLFTPTQQIRFAFYFGSQNLE